MTAREHPGGLADVQAEIRGHFQSKMKVGRSFLCDETHFSPWVLLSLDAETRFRVPFGKKLEAPVLDGMKTKHNVKRE